MKLGRIALIPIAVAHGSAHAGTPPDIDKLLEALTGASTVPAGTRPPHIYLGPYGGATTSVEPYEPVVQPEWTARVMSKVVAYAAGGRAAWVTADVKIETICIAEGCPPRDPRPRTYHETVVLDIGARWQPVALHVADSATEKDALANGPPPALPRAIEPGAGDVATLFESSLGDPKALAATVSDRKDAVLYGSEAPEKYVGGAKIKATLAKWNLGFRVRDGVQAGLVSSKTLAWVVTNVDATSLHRAAAKPAPYRVLAVYETTAAGWQLVVLQFSVYMPTI